MNIQVDKRKIASKSLISDRQKIKSLLKKENILLPLASKVESQDSMTVATPKEALPEK